jgi:hypothetical protein
MNLFHCPIFRWSRDGATHREGNQKSHRATIQSHKFKAVEWAPSRRPLDLRRAGSQIHRRGHRLTRSGLHSSSANRQVRLDSSANCQASIRQPIAKPARLAVRSPRNRATMPDVGRSTIPTGLPRAPTRAGDPPFRALRINPRCRAKHPIRGGIRELASRDGRREKEQSGRKPRISPAHAGCADSAGGESNWCRISRFFRRRGAAWGAR